MCIFVCICRLLGCRGVQNLARDHLPSQSRVVVCGGGVVGCSVAYHLAKEGIKDVLLLEQGRYAMRNVTIYDLVAMCLVTGREQTGCY